MAVISAPLWQQITINSDQSPLSYGISYNEREKVIFTGTARKAPGDTSVKIRPNDVCANFLYQGIPFDIEDPATEFSPAPIIRLFDIEKLPIGETIETVEFYLDWSYDNSMSRDDWRLAPIDSRVTPHMLILATRIGAVGLSATIRDNDMGVLGDFAIEDLQPADATNFSILVGDVLAQYPNARFIEIGDIKYEIIDKCPSYALYYVNAYGGWESLRLAQGIQGETLYRWGFERGDSNVNYLNEITETWRLGTDWLTDEGAKNMPHLIGSTQVLLHDLEKNKVYPVILTDTSLEIKSYANQGRQIVRYDISVQRAQTHIRK